jgi:hypothetical protein
MYREDIFYLDDNRWQVRGTEYCSDICPVPEQSEEVN